MAALVAATHEHLSRRSVWVAGTSPAMTFEEMGLQMVDKKVVHLTEEQKTKRDALRAALIEGEQSGMSGSFDFEAFLKEQKRKRRSQKKKRKT